MVPEREIDPEAEARVRGVLRADDPAAVTINERAAPPEVSAVTNPPGVVTLGEVASRLSVLEVSCNAVRAMGGCALIACWWSMALRSRCRRCARSSRRTASGCRRHRSMILAGCISAACPGWRKRDRFTDFGSREFSRDDGAWGAHSCCSELGRHSITLIHVSNFLRLWTNLSR